MAAVNQPSKVLQVQKITCANNAAFVMYFRVRRDGDQESEAPTSDNYPVVQMRTFDLKAMAEDKAKYPNFSIKAKEEFWASVTALGGVTNQGIKLQYAPNGQTATFDVRGTTLNFTVTLIG